MDISPNHRSIPILDTDPKENKKAIREVNRMRHTMTHLEKQQMIKSKFDTPKLNKDKLLQSHLKLNITSAHSLNAT